MKESYTDSLRKVNLLLKENVRSLRKSVNLLLMQQYLVRGLSFLS